ncbi:hypothetical protein T492DRAFT_893793 [Pavlovales sp. CCMP2436]|nr:hypothetical protein T492DRAFT_893793 [Pavlovales sp. CCMP2436]
MVCWSERCVAHCLLRALVGSAGLGATARADGSPGDNGSPAPAMIGERSLRPPPALTQTG